MDNCCSDITLCTAVFIRLSRERLCTLCPISFSTLLYLVTFSLCESLFYVFPRIVWCVVFYMMSSFCLIAISLYDPRCHFIITDVVCLIHVYNFNFALSCISVIYSVTICEGCILFVTQLHTCTRALLYTFCLKTSPTLFSLNSSTLNSEALVYAIVSAERAFLSMREHEQCELNVVLRVSFVDVGLGR